MLLATAETTGAVTTFKHSRIKIASGRCCLCHCDQTKDIAKVVLSENDVSLYSSCSPSQQVKVKMFIILL